MSIYIDGILVTGSNEADHLRNLEVVLQRLQDAGLRLKHSKCSFMLPEVEYLGHCISAHGLKRSESKVQAISEAPTPKSTTELKSCLGLLNYYRKFLPNLSSILAPLNKLLQDEEPWSWMSEQEAAFKKVKEQLTSRCLLVHFDSRKDLIM